MRTPYFKILGFGILLCAILSSCDSDVELEAPYKNTPIIFGVLDFTADTQFVRINKAYLGAGNADEYAQIRDSVEYHPDDVEAWLYKKNGSNILDSIQLERIVKPSRDPGVFYNTDIAFYYTNQPLFTPSEIAQIEITSQNANWRYELVAHIKGETYRAETDFPDCRVADLTGPPSPPTRVQFYNAAFESFQNVRPDFSKRENTARYQGQIRFNFDYLRDDGSAVTGEYIDFQLGVINNQTSTNETGEASFSFNAENWFTFVGERVKAIPGIRKVQMANLEFRLTGGNEILNTYINLAQPISDFTPVTASFSNFDNGAIGILGSRRTMVKEFRITENSLEKLNTSELTTFGVNNPCYCVQDWTGSEFVCTGSTGNCP